MWSNDWLQLQVGSHESTDQQARGMLIMVITLYFQARFVVHEGPLFTMYPLPHYNVDILLRTYTEPLYFYLKVLVRLFFNEQHVTIEGSVCENLPQVIHNVIPLALGSSDFTCACLAVFSIL